MKAEEQKLETNSLSVWLAKAKEFLSGRGGYYVIGSIALLVAVGLLWRYFATSRTHVMDERMLRLEAAVTKEQLVKVMEDNKGNIVGSIAKMHLARRALRSDGLEKMGTDKPEASRQAAASLEQARTYFLELTTELKDKDDPAMLQEAWLGAAQAEEALVGYPKTDSGSDSRGNADKAIEYYQHAVKYFAEADTTKRVQQHLDSLTKNKDSFVSAQKELYKKRELPVFPPLPKGDPKKDIVPPVPTPNDPKSNPVPPIPPPPTLPMVPLPPDAKKDTKDSTPPKTENGPAPRPTDPKSK